MELVIIRSDGKEFKFHLFTKLTLHANKDITLHYKDDSDFTISEDEYRSFEVIQDGK